MQQILSWWQVSATSRNSRFSGVDGVIKARHSLSEFVAGLCGQDHEAPAAPTCGCLEKIDPGVCPVEELLCRKRRLTLSPDVRAEAVCGAPCSMTAMAGGEQSRGVVAAGVRTGFATGHLTKPRSCSEPDPNGEVMRPSRRISTWRGYGVRAGGGRVRLGAKTGARVVSNSVSG